MDLPNIDSLGVSEKHVLIRGDLDSEPGSTRLESLITTIKKLLEGNARQITIAGHRGKPGGKRVAELTNKFLVDYFNTKLSQDVEFIDDVENYAESDKKLRLLENLRFWPGEEENSEEFTQKIAAFGDVYVNDAFGVSHREHASIVGVPKLLPHAAGLRLVEEVENLGRILENPERPLVFLISGIKEDKKDYIDKFKDIADKVLVGGRLPKYFNDDYDEPKVQLARLLPDGEDITMKYIEHFEGEVRRAKTVVVSGPIGKFEDPGHRQGTERVFKAVAEANCFSVAGGGDTEAALEMFGLKDKIDWVSTGGGAMLEFLSTGTLPGLQALL